jgi:DNA-binding CsgD family transcriptional regulator
MARRTWEQYEKYLLQQWPLTRREVQIALECIKGKKNKEIASLLGISAETVNKTLDHIYRATGVNGRDQLVAKLLVADIDNTPLQQSLTLAGEGAALVGAGFVATLYASRGERKRPRSVRAGLLTSKSAADRSEPVDPPAPNVLLKRSEDTAAVAGAGSHSSGHLGVAEKIHPRGTEDLPWMIGPESLMKTIAGES